MHILNTKLPQILKLQRRQSLNPLIPIQHHLLNLNQTRSAQIPNITQPTIRQVQLQNLHIIKLGQDADIACIVAEELF